MEVTKKEAPAKSENLRRFNVFVDEEYFEVGVDSLDGAPVVSYVQPAAPMAPMVPAAPAAPAAPPAPAPAAPEPPAPEPEKAPEPAAAEAVEGTTITAPMPGMIVRYEKQVGDAVSEGETVVVLEAMKMENALAAPASGTIKAIIIACVDSVSKGDVL